MKSRKGKLLVVFLAATCWCGTGCNDGDTDMARGSKTRTPEAQNDEAIPGELLAPEFLQSLSVSVSNDLRRRETKAQPLEFPADSPEAKRARRLLLWLLSLKKVEQLPLNREEPRLPTLRLRFWDDDPAKGAVFAVDADPEYGGDFMIRVRKQGTMRRFSLDDAIEKEIADFWDFCSRSASVDQKE